MQTSFSSFRSRFTLCINLLEDAERLFTYDNFKSDFTPLKERYWLFGNRLLGLLLVRSRMEGPNAAPTCLLSMLDMLIKHYF